MKCQESMETLLSGKVVSFLERGDNSRVMPRKKGFGKVAKGVSIQKRMLNY